MAVGSRLSTDNRRVVRELQAVSLQQQTEKQPNDLRRYHHHMRDDILAEVQHLTKIYGNFKAVDDVSFFVRTGEIVGLLGPSGAGKTTTIHMMLGLVSPSAGSVRIFGKRFEENYPLLAHFGDLQQTGFPLLAGVSRKSFVGRMLARDGKDAEVGERLNGTLAAETALILKGAHIIRTHDVRFAVEVARVADTIVVSGG